MLFLLLTSVSMVIIPIVSSTAKSLDGRKVVLMSMDGFRHDYLTKADTPNFDALIASGVKVPYVNNSFTTLTFPSHYTIVTGLYEESHGIIANAMYDPVFNATFKMGNVETRWWDGGEPIWINAVKSGLKVGTYFWPGSETELQGRRPTKWRTYDEKMDYKDRVDTLVSYWLARDNFDFGIIYFDEPDHSGHKYGPDAPQMVPVIERMDDVLGYFMQKLADENLKDRVDFIVTSDHGMASIDMEKRIVGISDYVNSTLLKKFIGGGAVANLIPQPGKDQELVDALSGINNISVYLKKDIPDKYYYKNNRRVMPVVVIADEGWDVRMKSKNRWSIKGNHGFSNAYMSMKPILIASGPSFKKGVEVDPIKNEDIYPLLCHLLNLDPAPHNGSFERVKPFLGPPPDSGDSAKSIFSTVSLYTVFLTVVLSFLLQGMS